MESNPSNGAREADITQKYPYYLLLISFAYVLAAANEYWIVNWFKEYGVKLPLYFAILQNSSWPIQFYIYLQERKSLPQKRVISYDMMKSYGILGCLAAFINLTRMIALANLPPVLTVICSNTEIVFETAMTVFVLKHKVSYYQYSAVALVIFGVFIALYDPTTHTFGGASSSAGTTNKTMFMTSVILSIMSRFASSLNTILAEKFLGKGAKSKIGVKECTLVNSVVPFFILPFGLLVTKEYQLWPAQLYFTPSAKVTAVIALLSIAICESKHIDRFSKYAIVEHTSTIFFAGVDSAMKMIAGIMSFVLFPSHSAHFQWPYLVGFLLIAAAVVLLYVDKRLSTAQKAREAQQHQQSEQGLGALKDSDVVVSQSVYNPLAVLGDEENLTNMIVIVKTGSEKSDLDSGSGRTSGSSHSDDYLDEPGPGVTHNPVHGYIQLSPLR